MVIETDYIDEEKFVKSEFEDFHDMSHEDWLRKMREYLNHNVSSEGMDKPLSFKVFDNQNKFVGTVIESAVMKYLPLPLDVLLVGNTLKTLSSGFCVQLGKYLIVPQPKIKISTPISI